MKHPRDRSARILHLSAYDVFGGAALAAHRLHLGLRDAGWDSAMCVRRKYGSSPAVEGPHGFFPKLASRLRRRHDRSVALRAGWRGAPPFSPAVVGRPLRSLVRGGAPVLVHAHWIGDGFVRVEELIALGRPLVWTLHDMWPLTGGCHYAGACRRYQDHCGSCPVLGARKLEDLSHQLWARKRSAYAAIPIVGVAPSRWLAEIARSSSLFRDRPVHVIANGIDVDVFAPRDRLAARAQLGLPAGRQLVIAGASRFRDDPRKGFDLFREIAMHLSIIEKARYAFAVFGTGVRSRFEVDGVEIHELGVITDEQRMATVYAAADVFVAPSREDNLPNTLLESLACGTAVASFAIGGIPEIIDDGVEGCVAQPFDVDELGRKIHQLASDLDRLHAASMAARKKAEARFSVAAMVRHYGDLYAEILGNA